MKFCQYCGKQMDDDALYCESCGKPTSEASEAEKRKRYARFEESEREAESVNYSSTSSSTTHTHKVEVKSRIAAGVLGICLGSLGIHKFYIGKIGQGILMLLFGWTGIPGIIGLVEGILYLCCNSDEEFTRKYCAE